jgi:E3 ubiquitin-protein ligase DOA10
MPLVFAQMSDAIRWLLGRDVVQDKMGMYLSTYPIFMVVVGVIVGAVYARRTVDKWRDSVRDEIYLVGEVLHNLDDEGR